MLDSPSGDKWPPHQDIMKSVSGSYRISILIPALVLAFSGETASMPLGRRK